MGNSILVVGHETVSSMIGLSPLALLRDPDQLAVVRDDESAATGVVEELLRLLAVAPPLVRQADSDLELGGWPVKAGSGSCSRHSPPTTTPAWRPTSPAGSTCGARRWPIWRSGSAPTSASGSNSPDWNCRSRCRPCCAACPDCVSPWTSTPSSTATTRWSSGWPGCR